ncbi:MULTISPECIES: prephenate dehydratase [unclassified Oceanobacter]|uniref:prephenate dehydratase n=1 Tax=unclassified Oceanobacter TaxID=2620260 RepID=UPI0027335F15|nr:MULTISPECIES: prephenate dehydratase [unclassified Oceanobacter]MDP2609521.1 prephenate dehydratase [Oceanobacter sp. 1_MG-2023]MDP2613018.1 prephenate dehydratase [Oceanobacter sp. 2_MG-2023]
MSEAQELEQLRQSIDSIDRQIQELINQRARCAQQVAEVKEKYAAPGESVIFYRPEREAQVLRNVMVRNTGPLPDENMARLFREIMSQCLALEEPLNVAFLGPEGTFTQQAAVKHFGHAVCCHSQVSIGDVFREVESGAANFGVVPVENSTEGVVTHTLDSFFDSNLQICGEVSLRIHHHLMSQAPAQPIERIYSHAQSLGQCRRWLDQHYPDVERIALSSNAEAARRASLEPGSAAIAGEVAADLYQLVVCSANIEDRPDNTTRFLIVGRQATLSSGEDKTSIMVSSRNQPGALYQVLEPFHQAGISLTRIETRPARTGTWNYAFFIDFEGHSDDAVISTVLEQLQQVAADYKWLGSYPKAVL